MAYFAGTFLNRTDKKLRVTVPPKFRTLLTLNGVHSFFLRPSFTHDCLEAVQHSQLDQIADQLRQLGPLSLEREALATVLFAEASEVLMDPEGRIAIPEHLRSFAKLGEEVLFAGLGDKFQLWEPAAFDTHLAEARLRARESLQLLMGSAPVAAAGGGR